MSRLKSCKNVAIVFFASVACVACCAFLTPIGAWANELESSASIEPIAEHGDQIPIPNIDLVNDIDATPAPNEVGKEGSNEDDSNGDDLSATNPTVENGGSDKDADVLEGESDGKEEIAEADSSKTPSGLQSGDESAVVNNTQNQVKPVDAINTVGTSSVLLSSNAQVNKTQLTADDSSAKKTTSSASSARAAVQQPKTPTIESGSVYEIASLLAQSKRLDVAGGSTKNCAPVQLYSGNYTPAQRWRIYDKGNGLFEIVSVLSGKALDVSGASVKNGTGVQVYQRNNTNAQLWRFVSDSNGSYRIVSALSSNYVLDLAGANTANGTGVQIYRANGTDAQRWVLKLVAPVLDNGYYSFKIESSGKAMDVAGASYSDGANVQQYSANGTLAQTYYLNRDASSGYYTVYVSNSGKVLDVAGAVGANGTNVQIYSSNGTFAQKWALVKNSDGTYTLRSAVGGFALDVSGASTNNGANVQIYSSNGTKAQKWVLTKKANWIPDGAYNVLAACNPSNAFAVTGAISSSGSNVKSIKANDSNSQRFFFTYAGNGAYYIQNAYSGLHLNAAANSAGSNVFQGKNAQQWTPVLTSGGVVFHSKSNYQLVADIANASKSSGANIQLYSSNGTVAQKFILMSTSALVDGAYRVASAADKAYVLDVKGASSSNGAQIQLYGSNGTSAQSFSFEQLSNGNYLIKNTATGKVIQASANSFSATQQTRSSSAMQQWKIRMDVDGNKTFVNVGNGKTLGFSGSKAANEAPVGTSANSGSLAQKWSVAVIASLNGIDISSWQSDLDVSKISADFVIVKATQGTKYSSPVFTKQANATMSSGKLLGTYHFMEAGSSPEAQADYYVKAVSQYKGDAIYVLDWENSTNSNVLALGPSVAKRFLDRVYSLTGVRPLIYMSKSVTREYDWSPVASNYGLWVAQYPNYDSTGYQSDPWTDSYGYGAWSAPTIFQYSSSGKLSGYNGSLDLDKFYGDAAMWKALQ